MNKGKSQWQPEDVDYWRSMVDIIIGLLLVILLVMALMIMGLLDQKEGQGDYTAVEPSPTATSTPSPSPTPTPTPTPVPTQVPEGWNGGGGGGAWNTPEPTATPRTYEFDKSAVRVIVRDSDTGTPLTEVDASFSLLEDDVKQTLYVRYPDVKGYSVFSTQDKGSFYLPEKLLPGEYVLKPSKLLDEYDLPEQIVFELEKDHDWEDPYTVEIEAVPCRNVIRLEMTDSDTGDSVLGAVCNVVAASDIIAGDGSIRYHEGDIVDTITCSSEKSSVSSELYLGDYYITQAKAAFGYADTGEKMPVSLKRRASSESTEDIQLKVDRTKAIITARDGSEYKRLEGIKFQVTGKNSTTECVTDENGEITLVNLEKSTRYSVVQTESYLDYQYDTEPIVFTVDANGLIDGNATFTAEQIQNRIVCTFDVKGQLLPISVRGCSMTLKDENGTVIDEWTTGSDPHTLTSLNPGTYTLETENMMTEITVLNTADEQSFVIRRWNIMDTAVAAISILLLGGLVYLIIRRRKRKI